MNQRDSRGEINYFRIPVDENSYSQLTMGTPDFPVHLSFDNLTDYENCFVNWHKQREIEISLVTNGSINVCLPGYSEVFNIGDVFIIFPDVLHSIKKTDKDVACEYRTLLFSPIFLCGYENSFWENNFYRPLKDKSTSILEFRNSSYEAIISELASILTYPTEDMNPLQKMQLQHKLQESWAKLYRSMYDATSITHGNEAIINQMLIYLHQHYAERFSLDSLSAEVGLSRSECCRRFKKNMDMTLMEYLLEYRIGKAMELMEHTSLSMTEIAADTGFSSASKFSEEFRKKTGQKPMQYRKQL